MNIDAASLPTGASGPRAPIWLGQAGMMLIEGTLLIVLLIVYLYVRIAFAVWPPPGVGTPDFVLPTASLVLLLLSCIPMKLADRAAKSDRWSAVVWWTLINVAMAFVFLALRTIELNRLDFKWSSHIYGSIVWIVMGLHTMHAAADSIESLILAVVIARGWRGEKQRMAVEVDGLYWYFVVVIWVPFYFVFFLYPRLL
jgi:heme/copper-type cytochrome/quinol oxidase subunit 3